MATKKKAARKRKKVTKHKPNPVPVIEGGEYRVTTEELEHAKAQARKEGFKNGWEAAKLDAFETCCGPHPKDSFVVHPEVAKVVLPLVKTRLDEVHPDGASRGKAAAMAAHFIRFAAGEWAQAE